MELLLFATHGELVAAAEEFGVDGLVVDLESRGKQDRQVGYDTEITRQTPHELCQVRRASRLPIVCRINPVGPWTPAEAEAAIEAGADELLVPMLSRAAELEPLQEQVRGRCGLAAMIETDSAVADAAGFGAMPLSRVYVGLNDLHIDRGARHLFTAVSDGTVERVRSAVGDLPFGFAGVTHPGYGDPLPCHHLVNEMARLACDFTFLRRSFFRQAAELGACEVVEAITSAVQRARARPVSQVRRDHHAAMQAIDSL
jgi:hypothetical protein